MIHRLALHWQILIAMVVGASAGLVVNFTLGEHDLPEPVAVVAGELQPYGFAAPVRVSPGSFWSSDRPDQIRIQVVQRTDELPSAVRVFVGVLDDAARRKPAGERLADLAGWPALPDVPPQRIRELVTPNLDELQRADPAAYALFLKLGRSPARRMADALKLIGDLFLRLLKMVSIPLIIFSITSGVVGLGSAERLGRMFGGTLTYYVATSLLAITTGLLMVNLIRPGEIGRASCRERVSDPV